MSCSGKTTLGKRLAEAMQLPVVDLDAISWLPNWIERPREEFRTQLQEFVDHNESWIISGNYTKHTLDVSWPKATHIVRLHFPLRVILYRYFTRTFRRINSREQVCGENYETLYNAIFAEDPLLLWILNGYKRVNRKFDRYMAEDFADKQWIVITDQKQQVTIHHSITEQLSA